MVELDKLIPLAALRLKYLAKIDKVIIDDFVFTLHYRYTFVLLLACSILITCNQFFGDPIKCIKGGDVPDNLLNTFCWIEGTFTLPKALIKVIDRDVPAPGVEQFYEKDEVLPHAYYQWVCIVLFLQGCCFYATRRLWKDWEGGKINHLMMELNKVILPEEKKKEKEDVLVNYLLVNRNRHNSYALRYFICEVLNFANVILQIIFVNWFLGGNFSNYGIEAVRHIDVDTEKRPDPISKTFPKLTKCTFRRFGPSGDVMKFDNLCLMPLNILNEKIYIAIWFWFYFLAIISGIIVLYRILTFAFPRSRYFVMRKFHHLISPLTMDAILSRFNYGDWFLLFLLGRNLDTMHYRDVIIILSERLETLPEPGVVEVDSSK